ncbi:MAG: hypothetical protein LBO82_08830, partial [Synergistaceae bacterium]|nr:hypothetical protein [Synergistaceae bacterium]
DVGGLVGREKSLVQDGDAWVGGDAEVYGNARVCDYRRVYENATVFGDAEVCDCARVFGNAQVFGNASVCNGVRVFGEARVCDNGYREGGMDRRCRARFPLPSIFARRFQELRPEFCVPCVSPLPLPK